MEAIKETFVPRAANRLGFSFVRNLHLKAILTLVILLAAIPLFAQSKAESEILTVSRDLFRWETERKFDSVANLIEDKFVVVSSIGTKRGNNEYLTDLKNGKPVHNKIDVQEATATLQGTTAIVVGKGVFVTTVDDNKTTSHLSYMEVFVKENKNRKLIALYASRISD
jgi:hypothetical protein